MTAKSRLERFRSRLVDLMVIGLSLVAIVLVAGAGTKWY